MLGQWKNYEYLEESLTIIELMETYEKILDNRSSEMEFDAKIAGVELKSSAGSTSRAREESTPSLVERLKDKKNKEMESKALNKGTTQFSDGVAYQVI